MKRQTKRKKHEKETKIYILIATKTKITTTIKK